LPFKIFRLKVNQEIGNEKKIRIEENPYAVKRVSEGKAGG
jgi:hypothetical protein